MQGKKKIQDCVHKDKRVRKSIKLKRSITLSYEDKSCKDKITFLQISIYHIYLHICRALTFKHKKANIFSTKVTKKQENTNNNNP